MSGRLKARCGACGAEVRWVRLTDGTSVAIEPAPAGDGNVAFQEHLPGLAPPAGTSGAHALIVGGIRTKWARHLDRCRKADVYRSRWKLALACLDCREPLAAFVNRRQTCASCQQKRREELERIAGALCQQFGADLALAKVEQLRQRLTAPAFAAREVAA